MFSLFYVTMDSWQTAHYLFLKVMMKGSMVFNSDHLENSLMTNENPWKNQIYGLRVLRIKGNIFVCGMKVKELMITSQFCFTYFIRK